MKVWRIPSEIVVLVACVAAIVATPVLAGVDVDFGASVRVGDHTDLFFSISSRYFDRDPRVVDDWGRRFTNPDDLAVFLFLVRTSGKDPHEIARLRHSGLTWFDVGVRVGVPADAWFVAVDRDPGPPYGRAYGHWKKHERDRNLPVRLTDTDARNLVAVRVIHEYYGVPVAIAMEWRASGRDIRALVVQEYHHRHGTGMEAVKSRPVKPRGGKKPESGHRGRKEDRHHD